MVANNNLVQQCEVWGYAVILLKDSVRSELFINLGDNNSRLQYWNICIILEISDLLASLFICLFMNFLVLFMS